MGRAPCCEKSGLKKGPWTPEEDEKLVDYIQKNGCGNWRTLPKNAGLQRCGKSCRLRWTNYLRPDIKRGRFSFEEEETIIQMHSVLGNKWSAIAARLPGRTDNEIKNYWNTHIRKKLLRMGIDPVTHAPRLDLLKLCSLLNSVQYGNSASQLMDISRLLGSTNPLINQELISSVLSSSNGLPPLIQTPVQDLTIPNFEPSVPVPNHQLMGYDQVCQVNDQWQQRSGTVATEGYTNFGCYGSDELVLDPKSSSDTSTFQCNSNNNFSFQSVLSNISTPSSSPAQTYNVNSSSTENERESYSSNMFEFDISNILNVDDFM